MPLWRYKSLCLVGVLASFTVYQTSWDTFKSFLFSNTIYKPLTQTLGETWALGQQIMQNAQIVLANDPKYFIQLTLLTLLVLFLVILLMWLSLVSKTAIIAGILSDKYSQLFSWKENIQIGVQKFWKVLFLHLALGILLWLILQTLPAIGGIVPQSIQAVYIPIGVIILAIIFSAFIIIQNLAMQFIIRTDSPLLFSLKQSLTCLKSNLIPSLGVFIWISFVKTLPLWLAGILLNISLAPLAMLGVALNQWTSLSILSKMTVIGSGLLSIAYTFLITGILTAYELALWTLAFNKFKK